MKTSFARMFRMVLFSVMFFNFITTWSQDPVKYVAYLVVQDGTRCCSTNDVPTDIEFGKLNNTHPITLDAKLGKYIQPINHNTYSCVLHGVGLLNDITDQLIIELVEMPNSRHVDRWVTFDHPYSLPSTPYKGSGTVPGCTTATEQTIISLIPRFNLGDFNKGGHIIQGENVAANLLPEDDLPDTHTLEHVINSCSASNFPNMSEIELIFKVKGVSEPFYEVRFSDCSVNDNTVIIPSSIIDNNPLFPFNKDIDIQMIQRHYYWQTPTSKAILKEFESSITTRVIPKREATCTPTNPKCSDTDDGALQIEIKDPNIKNSTNTITNNFNMMIYELSRTNTPSYNTEFKVGDSIYYRSFSGGATIPIEGNKGNIINISRESGYFKNGLYGIWLKLNSTSYADKYEISINNMVASFNTPKFEANISYPHDYENQTYHIRSCDDYGELNVNLSNGVSPFTLTADGKEKTIQTSPITDMPVGQYNIQIMDATGCEATISPSANVNFKKPAQFVFSIDTSKITHILCTGNKNSIIPYTISGGILNYIINIEGNPQFSSADAKITGLAVGKYNITAYDNTQCYTTISEVPIREPKTLPSIISVEKSAPTCSGYNDGKILKVNAEGGTGNNYQYKIGVDGQWVASNVSTSNFVGDQKVSLVVKDAVGCETPLYETPIPSSPLKIQPGISGNTNSSCPAAANGGITITPQGGIASKGYYIKVLEYSGADNSPDNRTFAKYSSLKTGEYTVRIKDDNNCVVEEKFPIGTDNQYLSFTATPSPESCDVANDGKLIITVTPQSRTAYPITLDIGTKSTTINSTTNPCIFDVLDAGTYNVTVTDAAGCAPTSKSQKVDFTDKPLSLSVSGLSQPICPGKSGSFTLNRANGASTFSYTVLKDGFSYALGINPALSSNPLTNLPAGAYSITVQDSKRCTANVIQEIKPSGDPVTITQLDLKDQSCTGVNNGLIKVQAASTAGSIDSVYIIGRKAKNTPIYEFPNLPAATYQVKAIDINGCSKIQPYTIANLNNQPSLLKNGSTDVACTKATNGTLTVSASQTLKKMPYWFKIIGPGKKDSVQISSDVYTFSGLTNASYDISIRDNDNCRSTVSSFTINPITNPVDISIAKFDSVACDNAANGAAYFNVTGSMAPVSYSYQLKTGNTYSSPQTVNKYYSGLSRLNDYIIKVTDNFGCSDSTAAFKPPRKKNTLDILEKGLVNIACPGTATGKANYQRLNGIPNANGFDYSLTNNLNEVIQSGRQTSADFSFTGLAPGNYNLAITDAANCLVNKNFNLTEPLPAHIVSYDSTIVKAKGKPQGSISAYVDKGNFRYEYQLLKTGTSVGDSLIFAGKTPKSLLSLGTTLNFNSLYAGIYKVQVRDTARCNNDEWLSTKVNIVEPANFLTLKVNKTDVRCFGENSGSLLVSGDGGWGNYTYSRDSVNFTANALYNSLVAGKYKLFVKDKEGVVYGTTALVNEPSVLQSTLVSKTDALCNNSSDGTAVLSINGGNGGYQVSANHVDWLNDNTYRQFAEGSHILYVRDQLGCENSVPVTIDAPPLLMIADTSIFLSRCSQKTGAIKVLASGGVAGYKYNWQSTDTSFNGTNYAQNLASGIYTLTLSDNNGCSRIFSFAVSDSTGVDVKALSVNPVSCWGKSDGSAQIGVIHGKEPVTITWPNGNTGLSMNGLAAGNQILWVVDAENCKRFDTITISTPENIYISTRSITDPLCTGANNGSIGIEAAGGTGSMSYAWSNGSNGRTINKLSPGYYVVTVTDANNCNGFFTFELNNQKQVNIDLGPDITLCKGSSFPLAPGSFADYKWKSDAGFTSYDTLIYTSDPGRYYVEVRDWDNCIGKDSILVNYSANTLNAEFLVNSEVMTGDTVMIIEISWPMPDSLAWKIPAGASVVETGNYYRKLIFNEPGDYKLDILAYRSDCFDIQSKSLKVVPFDASKRTKSEKSALIQYFNLFPNPNSGNFTVDIRLSKKMDGILRVVNVSRGVTADFRQLRNSDIYSEPYALPNLPAGIYALYLQVGNESRTITFIVQ